MAEYLVGHGVDPADVVAETRSRTTEQNLVFSRHVATEAMTVRVGERSGGPLPGGVGPDGDADGGSRRDHGGRPRGVGQAAATRDSGAQRPLLVVTNGYHAPRAALLSRKVGVAADVIGAKTARYFVPSAFLREFVAVLAMNRWLHLAVGGLYLLACLVLLVVSLNR
jgi:uncharacterized SAM-binding protein YcdF (DUF218 family)